MKVPFKEALLVDDDATANFIHRQFLKKLHVAEQVKEVFHGKEALQFIK